MGAINGIVVLLATLGVVAYGYWLLSRLSFNLTTKVDTVAQHDDVPERLLQLPPSAARVRQSTTSILLGFRTSHQESQ